MKLLFIILTVIYLFYDVYCDLGLKPICEIRKNTEYRWWDTDCGKFCHQVGKKVTCNWWQYHMGCFCKEGYFRNRMWDCVPLEGCSNVKNEAAPPEVKPVKCPKREEFKKCGNQCMKLCESLLNPLACSYTHCDTGCYCRRGLFRNEKGVCVRKPKCGLKKLRKYLEYSQSFQFKYSKNVSLILSLPSKLKCERNEEYTSCGDACSEMCRNIEYPDNCPLTCQTGCFCKMGFYRTDRGICVKEAKCPNIKKPKPTSGGGSGAPTTTTEIPVPITESPKPPTEDGKCPKNENYTCGSRCKDVCENEDNDKNCSPNMKCEDGCFCKKGYYRNNDNVCVLRRDCGESAFTTPEPPIKCGANERYTACGSNCSETCTIFTETEQKDCPPKCDVGCFCMQGFYRDSYKQCVPQDQCVCEIPPLVCGTDTEEYTTCGPNCLKTCSTDKPSECKNTCARGCFCKEGYERDNNGVCVKPKDCKLAVNKNLRPEEVAEKVKIIECNESKNEVYTVCGNLCTDYCEDNYEGKVCPMNCEKGCICKEGYKRNPAEQCVPVEKCNELPVCNVNEAYSDCGMNCGFKCKDIGRNKNCPLECSKGCFCIPGYYRDDNGTCIKLADCVIDNTPVCGEREFYSNCSTHCGETCEDLINPIECPKDDCDNGCFCRAGYYRDLSGNCGPKLNCDLPASTTQRPVCLENEMYDQCGSRCDESCDDIVNCKKTCEPGCFCVKNYLRNKRGICVTGDKCKGPPQCAECTRFEFYSDCSSDCGRFCSDINKHTDCKGACNMGCFCKYGYYRNLNGECVTKNDCPIEEINGLVTAPPTTTANSSATQSTDADSTASSSQ